jgi:hypothetical protein
VAETVDVARFAARVSGIRKAITGAKGETEQGVVMYGYGERRASEKLYGSEGESDGEFT